MKNEKQRQQINGVEVTKEWVDGIPVIYAEPAEPQPERILAIFLSGLGGKKEELVSYLSDIADRGFIALAFDLYQHGERGTAQDLSLIHISSCRTADSTIPCGEGSRNTLW